MLTIIRQDGTRARLRLTQWYVVKGKWERVPFSDTPNTAVVPIREGIVING